MTKHEDGPLFGRQSPEPAFELVPVDHGQELIGSRRSVDRQHVQIGQMTALTHRRGQTGVDEETAHPRVEPVRIAELGQVTPGDHQRLLKGILGSVDIAEDAVRGREEAVGPRAHQVGIGLLVATLGGLHAFAVHRSPSIRPHRALSP